MLYFVVVLEHSRCLEVDMLQSIWSWCLSAWIDHGVSTLPQVSCIANNVRWAHEICSGDNEERAIVTGSMNQMAYLFQMWLPLVAWQQIKAPRYTAGFATITFLNIAMVVFTSLALYLQKRKR